MSRKRVVITGMGLVTPCGEGWQPYWASVLAGKSHIRQLNHWGTNGYPHKFAGEIEDFDPTKTIKNRKSLKVMSRTIMFAVIASDLAIRDSALAMDKINAQRFGVSLGTGVINNDLDELAQGIREGLGPDGVFDIKKFGQSGVRALFPLWFLKYLPNMPACHISIVHGLKGPNNTVTTSAAAGAQAIGEAFRVIERGDADIMIAGSTDSKINAMGLSRFQLLGLLSQDKQGSAHEAYCPFDIQHDGMILGEGAGLLILEEYKHAKARGARIYGEIRGYGSCSDFIHDPRTAQDFTGKCLAMERALHSASILPEEVDAVLANGSGIPQEDIHEAQALHIVFQRAVNQIVVTGVKPITGHLVYGSAGVELAAGLLSLRDQVIPPLVNLKKPDPACDLPFVLDRPLPRKVKTILFNSFGFGGQNASLVVSHHE